MAEPEVLVLRAAGTNCNEETAYAFELAGAKTRQIHVNRLKENSKILDDFGAVVIPGGFSYGDDIAAGSVLALELDHALGDSLRRLLSRGGLVLGICNGFQVLMRSGLLPGPEASGASLSASLIDNESHRYIDRWVNLRSEHDHSHFLRAGLDLELPVAHAEGRFVVASDQDVKALEAGRRVALRYLGQKAGEAAGFPANPNGSLNDIAGLSDASGQVLGLMPHPERFLFDWQHPQWTRRASDAKTASSKNAQGEGFQIFENAVRYLAS
ncbi:MAG: phosphoribosylformylglycinamidine synthase I [Planctomycetota bacterium]